VVSQSISNQLCVLKDDLAPTNQLIPEVKMNNEFTFQQPIKLDNDDEFSFQVPINVKDHVLSQSISNQLCVFEDDLVLTNQLIPKVKTKYEFTFQQPIKLDNDDEFSFQVSINVQNHVLSQSISNQLCVFEDDLASTNQLIPKVKTKNEFTFQQPIRLDNDDELF
jgi:hypothetical protein